MKNDILDWLAKEKLGWETCIAKSVGLTFVNTLSDALWYLDGTAKTLDDRSLGIPTLLSQFQGYKQPEKHKHRKVLVESLKAADLRSHSVALFNLCSSSYMKSQHWKAVQEAVHSLASNMQQYSLYLDCQREASKQNRSRMMEQTDVDEIGVLASCEGVPPVHYAALHKAIQESDFYQPGVC